MMLSGQVGRAPHGTTVPCENARCVISDGEGRMTAPPSMVTVDGDGRR
ncbi:MAG: hypothetical protein OXU71_10155 [Gammaproteobacteria bacterium]|nr:hypothetical protein [Gammaproteobacteria bacterium]